MYACKSLYLCILQASELPHICRQSRQQVWQERKKTVQQSELERRQAVLQAAEDDKMAQFRALAASGPITIPKRQ